MTITHDVLAEQSFELDAASYLRKDHVDTVLDTLIGQIRSGSPENITMTDVIVEGEISSQKREI